MSEKNEKPDISAIELGYLIKNAKMVKMLEGEPAYYITLSEPQRVRGMTLKSPSVLLAVPTENDNIVILFSGSKIQRLENMTNQELIEFVRTFE